VNRFTIGSFPDWTTGAAREEAKRLKCGIDGGADPVGDLLENRAAPTVADLCARFEVEYLPRKRISTQRDYRQQISVDIVPAIGRLRVAAVTFADIDALHRKISARAPTMPIVSSRCCRGFSVFPFAGICAPTIRCTVSSAIPNTSATVT